MNTERPKDYKTRTAKRIVDAIKGGSTITEMCTGSKGVPTIMRFLEWVEDPTCKIWNRGLKECYLEAMDIRAKVWQDRAMSDLELLKDTASSQQIRRAEVQANMRLKQSQIHTSNRIAELKARAAGTNEPISITIKRFERPREHEETGSEA